MKRIKKKNIPLKREQNIWGRIVNDMLLEEDEKYNEKNKIYKEEILSPRKRTGEFI